MKKTAFACFVTAYILVCCTVASAWVEQQMTLTGRVMCLSQTKRSVRYVEIPLWMAWHADGKYHLFSVEAETGTDEITRDIVREISEQDYSVNEQEGYLSLPIVKDFRILYAASRYPNVGETVNIAEGKTAERLVLVFTPDMGCIGTPAAGKSQICAFSDTACLLQLTENTPFLEKEQLHALYPTAGSRESLRAVDLTDTQTFLENLPPVWAAVLLMTVGLFWALCAWLQNRKMLLVLPSLTPWTAWLLLRESVLPTSLLPVRCILDLDHYRTIQNHLRLSGLYPVIQRFLSATIRSVQFRCAAIAVIAILLLLPILVVILHGCKRTSVLRARFSSRKMLNEQHPADK